MLTGVHCWNPLEGPSAERNIKNSGWIRTKEPEESPAVKRKIYSILKGEVLQEWRAALAA